MKSPLKTPRLTLRVPVLSDARRVATLIGERDVARMIYGVPHPYTLEDAREWLSDKIGHLRDNTCAIDDGTGLIGIASLSHVGPKVRRLGFWLGKPYWGNGLMSEAVAALVGWGFDKGGLDRIESAAFMDNIASRRIHAKLGFAEGASVTLDAPARETAAPSILMSLTREDWTRTR